MYNAWNMVIHENKNTLFAIKKNSFVFVNLTTESVMLQIMLNNYTIFSLMDLISNDSVGNSQLKLIVIQKINVRRKTRPVEIEKSPSFFQCTRIREFFYFFFGTNEKFISLQRNKNQKNPQPHAA